ncbi:hypothetical protein B0O99DRAFT_741286 [Bisporella sp. PMI_857]|nr:hypothetical protein B0O99DRAFT_741286 [Bisporella sp. PMI_857]
MFRLSLALCPAATSYMRQQAQASTTGTMARTMSPRGKSDISFITSNYEPMYLNTQAGYYQLIQPMPQPTESGGLFMVGTLTMSPKLANQSLPTTIFSEHAAFRIGEGDRHIRYELPADYGECWRRPLCPQAHAFPRHYFLLQAMHSPQYPVYVGYAAKPSA